MTNLVPFKSRSNSRSYMLRIGTSILIHPKLRNINLHNITHSIISPNPRDARSSNITPYCHISLPYITNFVIKANHQRSQPSHCAMCQHVECHILIIIISIILLFFFFFLHKLLNIGACICHITREGQVEWTPPTEVRGECIQNP